MGERELEFLGVLTYRNLRWYQHVTSCVCINRSWKPFSVHIWLERESGGFCRKPSKLKGSMVKSIFPTLACMSGDLLFCAGLSCYRFVIPLFKTGLISIYTDKCAFYSACLSQCVQPGAFTGVSALRFINRLAACEQVSLNIVPAKTNQQMVTLRKASRIFVINLSCLRHFNVTKLSYFSFSSNT